MARLDDDEADEHGRLLAGHDRDEADEVDAEGVARPSISDGVDRPTAAQIIAARSTAPGNFSIRGLLCGLVIGIMVVFSNTYFGLQTGWISGMAMPAALVSFAFFRTLEPLLNRRFTPVENVFVQSVVGGVGVMPLGCGFVGVIPALEYLLGDEEGGPLNLSLGTLVLWAVGICLFGVVLAVPLRREVIVREKLRFPTGTATALMISVLHAGREDAEIIGQHTTGVDRTKSSPARRRVTHQRNSTSQEETRSVGADVYQSASEAETSKGDAAINWRAKIRLMGLAFAGSATYTITTYFIPALRNLPILGLPLAKKWLWALNPSPAYVGQGIIMGPTTTIHMLIGAIIGWAILSPVAKSKGWAPGEVSDWNKGSRGWIVWVSLSIMLSDALVSLGFLIARPLVNGVVTFVRSFQNSDYRDYVDHPHLGPIRWRGRIVVPALDEPDGSRSPLKPGTGDGEDESEADAPESQLISTKLLLISLAISVALYFGGVMGAFPQFMGFGLALVALVLAFFLSLLGVRALGETDLNPVSGISKLTQLVFAVIVPLSGNRNAVTINLLAGAISESAATQAGDLMQDLKAGHLLGASPAAQTWGQMAGSVVGAAASAAIYKLYTSVYTIPSAEFQIPTGYVWVFTARLVTGKGLPPRAAEAAVLFGGVWAVLTAIRCAWRGRGWTNFVPGGIAIAVGMYNTPSFTLARVAGGLISWWWTRRRGGEEATVVVLASGLILGEGLFSIVNLGLASAKIPHLSDWAE